MKKIISILTVMTIFICGFSYASDLVDSNRAIKPNKYITDSLDAYNEIDYFNFSLSKKGSVVIELEFDVDGVYYIKFIDRDTNKVIQSLTYSAGYNTISSKENLSANRVRVPAGDYRISVTGDSKNFTDRNYKLRVNYEAESSGNYEKEYNDDAKNAMEIDTNETIIGNLQSTKDVDYYMFELTAGGTCQLNFEYNYQGVYNVGLYRAESNSLKEVQVNTASTQVKPYESDFYNQSFSKIRLPKGTYYIKVSNKTFSNEDYNLSVYHSSERYGNFEKEYNDTVKTANEITNNSYYLGNLNSSKDVDYYVTYIAKGELKLEFEVPTNSKYGVEVYKENNNQVVKVIGKDVDSNNSVIDLGEIEDSGRYYFKVYARTYSNEDYRIKCLNNVYTPVINSNIKIDLQIGNQYMNVNGVGKLIDNNGTTPVLSSGRTMLPIRAVIEALGGAVEWDENTFTTTVKIENKNIKIKIGDQVAYVNGTAKNLDVPAQLINKRTMLPLRFVMENLGADVSWDDNTQIIVIKR